MTHSPAAHSHLEPGERAFRVHGTRRGGHLSHHSGERMVLSESHKLASAGSTPAPAILGSPRHRTYLGTSSVFVRSPGGAAAFNLTHNT